MFPKGNNLVRWALPVFVWIVNFNTNLCYARAPPSSKLISGIWSEEGCIVPQDDKSRKIWGVATLWLLEDPVNPCNSPCGCPPEGLNPPFVMKPNELGGNTIPVLVQTVHLPYGRPQASNSGWGGGSNTGNGGWGWGGSSGSNGVNHGWGVSNNGVPPPGCSLPPSPAQHNNSIVRFPPVYPPVQLPQQPLPFVAPPPYPHPYPNPMPLPPPPIFVGPGPQPYPINPYPNPLYPPPNVNYPLVTPLHPGSSNIGISTGTTTTSHSDHDKTHVSADYNSDKGSKTTATTTSGSIGTGVPLFVNPNQVGISTGSTTVSHEDHDKTHFNVGLDSDKGSKTTSTTTSGGVAGVPGQAIIIPSQPGIAASTTTVTQEDHDKTHMNMDLNSDKGSKTTTTTTSGGVAGVPGQTIIIPPQPGIAASTTSVTQEDHDKTHLNMDLNSDKGSKTTSTTTTGGSIATGIPLVVTPPQIGISTGSTTVTHEDHDKTHLNLGYDKDQGSKTTTTSTSGGVNAVPGQTIYIPGQVGVAGTTTTVSNEDWDKNKVNMNLDKDTGSSSTMTTSGGVATIPSAQPCNCEAGVFPPGQHPFLPGPVVLPQVIGRFPQQHNGQNVDVPMLISPLPQPQGPFVAVIPPLQPSPFAGATPVLGPPFPYLPNQGVLPIPQYPNQPLYPNHGGHGNYPLIPPHNNVPPQNNVPPHNNGIIGSDPQPVLEPVIIDFGDVPGDNSHVPNGLSPPPNIGENTVSPPPVTPTVEPTPSPSFISKIPIIGPLLKPYIEPAPVVAPNVDNQPPPPVNVDQPSPNLPFVRPPPATITYIPIYPGVSPNGQQQNPTSNVPHHTVPVDFGFGPHPNIPGQPSGHVHPGQPCPLGQPTSNNPLHHTVPIDFGHQPRPETPGYNVPITSGGVPHGWTPDQPNQNIPNQNGIGQNPLFHTVPIDFGLQPRPQNPGYNVPENSGNVPNHNGIGQNPLFHTVPIDFGHQPRPQNPVNNVPTYPANIPLGWQPDQSNQKVPNNNVVAQNPLLHTVPIDFGHYPPSPNYPPQPSPSVVIHAPPNKVPNHQYPSGSGQQHPPTSPLPGEHPYPGGINQGQYPPANANQLYPPPSVVQVPPYPSNPGFRPPPPPGPGGLSPTPGQPCPIGPGHAPHSPGQIHFPNEPIHVGPSGLQPGANRPTNPASYPPVHQTGKLPLGLPHQDFPQTYPPPSPSQPVNTGPTSLPPPPSLGPNPQGPPIDSSFLPKVPVPTQQGVQVSPHNPNILVNEFGGGVSAHPNGLRPFKCPLGIGRCGNARSIEDFDHQVPENQLRDHTIEAKVPKQIPDSEPVAQSL